MKTRTHLRMSAAVGSVFAFAVAINAGLAAEQPAVSSGAGDVLLIVRGDDIGMAQAINEACIKSYREGIVKSVEIVVPGPWFLDAVRLLKENPGLDVGVHLTLTSEWEGLKWRPLTPAPSLVDENGYFYAATGQAQGAAKVTSFLGAKPKAEEVERELRAQIESAKKHIPQVSHLSAHMGTATATPEFRGLVQRLAAEYKLPLEGEGLRHVRWGRGETAAEREATLIDALQKLEPGRWLIVEHPGFDTPEMRGLGHPGNYGVAVARAAVTAAFTSPKVKQVVRQRGIKLVSYAELQVR